MRERGAAVGSERVVAVVEDLERTLLEFIRRHQVGPVPAAPEETIS